MNFNDFLNLTKVVRMLYGTTVAGIFFEQNINKFYNLTLKDLTGKLDSDKIGSSHTNS